MVLFVRGGNEEEAAAAAAAEDEEEGRSQMSFRQLLNRVRNGTGQDKH